jgi:hypothetical protein
VFSFILHGKINVYFIVAYLFWRFLAFHMQNPTTEAITTRTPATMPTMMPMLELSLVPLGSRGTGVTLGVSARIVLAVGVVTVFVRVDVVVFVGVVLGASVGVVLVCGVGVVLAVSVGVLGVGVGVVDVGVGVVLVCGVGVVLAVSVGVLGVAVGVVDVGVGDVLVVDILRIGGIEVQVVPCSPNMSFGHSTQCVLLELFL